MQHELVLTDRRKRRMANLQVRSQHRSNCNPSCVKVWCWRIHVSDLKRLDGPMRSSIGCRTGLRARALLLLPALDALENSNTCRPL